ncbi:MAG: AI-2E family transporter [Candidatus Altimarinota bacterium]
MKKTKDSLNEVLGTIKKKITNIRDKAEQIRKNRNTMEHHEHSAKVVLPVEKTRRVKVELSALSIAKSTAAILMVLLLAYFILNISNVLILFFIAFFIAAALDPLIDVLQRFRIPRVLGLGLVYIVSFVLIALMIASLLPVIADQLVGIARMTNDVIVGISTQGQSNYPFAEQIKPLIDELYAAIDVKALALQLQNSLQLVSTQIVSLGGNLWSVLMFITNGLMNLLLIAILVFFMTVDEKAVENFCISIFPNKYSEYISDRMQMVKTKIGHWIRGQFLVCVISGVATFIGLAVMGIEYSVILSVIAGVMMVIPVFGRVFAWLIALPIVLSQSPILALYMTIFYLAISQVENNIMVPLLMNKAVGLSPILIIFALLVGGQFLGLLGLVLAIPMATIIAIFLKDLGKRINSEENKRAALTKKPSLN